MFAYRNNFSAASWPPAFITEDALSSSTNVTSKLLSRTGIDPRTRETTAANRCEWIQPIFAWTPMFEAEWRRKAEEKRKEQKRRLAVLFHRPSSLSLTALNSMQGLPC